MDRWILLSAALLCASANSHASCGAAFCQVNTNWSVQGVWDQPGARFDLRYEYIDQDQPRHGRDDVRVGEIRRHHDEERTTNRNWLATLDHVINERWAVVAKLPILSRDHDHIHNHRGAQLPEQWDFTEAGDLRVTARYTFPSGDPSNHSSGLIAGVKLPTGSFHVRNGEGDLAERSLQPGTGTTDAIIGGFYHAGTRSTGWFAQAQLQIPLDRRSDFEPGRQLTADLGVRQAIAGDLTGLLQLNAQFKARDRGAEAEPDDSGGTFVSLSPGLSYALGPDVQLYGFIQKPIYQRVNGVQLTADWSAAVGMSCRF
jgi:hypothetical protein